VTDAMTGAGQRVAIITGGSQGIGGKSPCRLERTARTASRRGPVPAGPELGADERRHVITHMQAIAERADRRTTRGLLLARQAYYLIGFDASPETMALLIVAWPPRTETNKATDTCTKTAAATED